MTNIHNESLGDDMPQFRSIEATIKYAKKVMAKVLQDEVASEIKDCNIRHNESDLYGAGSPNVYDRRMSLTNKDNFASEMVGDDTIAIYNTAEPNGSVMGTSVDGYQLSAMIEHGSTGIGKILGEGFWTEDRPATQNTISELQDTKSYVEAARRGLQKRGINVK